MTIEDVFDVKGRGLILIPDFSVVDNLDLPNKQKALIVSPSKSTPCELQLYLTHYNIRGCTDINRLWRIVPHLFGIEKAMVSPGDELRIFDAEFARKLKSNTA